MPSEYVLTYECDCGYLIKQRGMDMSNDVPHIAYEFMGQQHFRCDECGREHFSGDLDIMTEGGD